MGNENKPPLKFTARQKKIFLAVAETLLPPEVGTPFRADENNLIAPTEDFLFVIGKLGVRGFGTLLLLFEYAALIFVPRFKTFTQLSPSQRERYMEGWETCRFAYRRQLLSLFKFLIAMILLSDHEVRAALGYDPNCLAEAPK